MNKLIRCYEIEPCGDTDLDSIVVEADGSWEAALREVESSLESQFLRMEEEGGKWENIKVSVRCVLKTREELDTLSEE